MIENAIIMQNMSYNFLYLLPSITKFRKINSKYFEINELLIIYDEISKYMHF